MLYIYFGTLFRKVIPMIARKMMVGLITATIVLGALTAWAADPPTANKSAPSSPTYACPMHPHIQATFPGACPVCRMALKPNNADPSTTSASLSHDAHAGMNMGGMGMGMTNCPHCTMGMGGTTSPPSVTSGTMKVMPSGVRTVGGRRCGC
jgi:hypothetical protein